MRAWPGWGQNGSQPRGDGGGGWEDGNPGRQIQRWRGRKIRDRNRPRWRKTLRNVDKSLHGAKVRGSGPEGGDLGRRSKGTESPKSPLPSLPAPNPLNPHPKQDAVSMATWPTKKGGLGTAEEIFHISSKGGGCDSEKELAHTVGATRAPDIPGHCAHCLRDSHPTPTQQTCTLPSGPLWGRLGEAQGSNVQRSVAAQASGGGDQPAANGAQTTGHQIQGHGPRQGPVEGWGGGLRSSG